MKKLTKKQKQIILDFGYPQEDLKVMAISEDTHNYIIGVEFMN